MNREEARALARELHKGQIRKSNGRDYFDDHLDVVGVTVKTYVGKDDEDAELAICAAYLHDSIEDQEVDESLIDPKILAVVKELSEDKSLEWEERKQRAVDDIPSLSHAAALVKAADILSNIKGLFRDGHGHKNAVWKNFKRGKEQTVGFYTTCVEKLCDREDIPETLRLQMCWYMHAVKEL